SERRREPDVELARPHADADRGEEVTRLVDEDQEGKPEDRDEDAHATATRSRAFRSASTSSSTSRAGEPSTLARTSATAPSMSRNRMRPDRKSTRLNSSHD